MTYWFWPSSACISVCVLISLQPLSLPLRLLLNATRLSFSHCPCLSFSLFLSLFLSVSLCRFISLSLSSLSPTLSLSGSSPLHPNWEERVDPSTGMTYYVNHVTKTTSWERPPQDDHSSSAPAPAPAVLAVGTSQCTSRPCCGHIYTVSETINVTLYNEICM
jgi:hypothetical protein